MHFFYLDESGDTGKNLDDPDQPIMVLGGISLRDEAWNKTHDELHKLLANYFGGTLPDNFELHANRLLNLDGSDEFEGHSLDDRTGLALDLLDLLADRKHGTHFVAFDKTKVKATDCGLPLAFHLTPSGNPDPEFVRGSDRALWPEKGFSDEEATHPRSDRGQAASGRR